MQNDNDNDRIDNTTDQKRLEIPAPSDQPNGIPTSGIGADDQKAKVDRLEARVKVGELWMISLTALMVLFTAFSVGIAFFQWQAMSSQLTEMKSQFLRDQRPYVMPAKIEPILPPPGGRIQFNLRWVNYGKSPAIKVKARAVVFIGKDALAQADQWFANDAIKPLINAPEMIVPPGIPPNMEDAQWASIYSQRGITSEEYEGFSRFPNFVVLGIRLEYSDMSGTVYSTNSCISSSSNGGIPNCPKHMEIE